MKFEPAPDRVVVVVVEKNPLNTVHTYITFTQHTIRATKNIVFGHRKREDRAEKRAR